MIQVVLEVGIIIRTSDFAGSVHQNYVHAYARFIARKNRYIVPHKIFISIEDIVGSGNRNRVRAYAHNVFVGDKNILDIFLHQMLSMRVQASSAQQLRAWG